MNFLTNEAGSVAEGDPLTQSKDQSMEKALMFIPSGDEDAAMQEEVGEVEKDVVVLKGKGDAGASGKAQVSPRLQQDTVAVWNAIIEEWKKVSTHDSVGGLVELVKRVPYATDNDCCKNFLALVSHEPPEQKGSEHTAKMDNLSREEERAIWRAKVEVERAKVQIGDAKVQIGHYLNDIRARIVSVHGTLLALSGRSQAEKSTHTGSKRSRSEFTDTDNEKDLNVLPARLERDRHYQPDERKKLVYFNDHDKRALDDFSELGDASKVALRTFSERLQGCVENAELFHDNRKEAYNQALCSLEDKLNGCDFPGEKLLIPGPLAREEAYAQPYLLTILRALGSTLDKVPTKGSPVKSDVLVNRMIPSTEHRPKRIVDKTISANSRYIFLFRDDAVEIPVEEKPGERKTVTPCEMLAECTDQVLSHLAKHVGIGFNFAGMGIDTRATGVVLTPVYVKIVQLRLENMGTKDVKLVLLETECMPLLSRANFDKWTKQGNESNWKDIKSTLYPSPMNDESSTSGVPSGLVALWNLMTSTRKDIVGPSPFVSDALGDLLGYGSFAAVYKHKCDEKHVIKLSRYGAKALLDREALVLKELQQKSGLIGIARFVVYNDLNVSVGGVDVKLPALTTKPRGIRIEMHLAKLGDEEISREVVTIGSQLSKALEFIHCNGFLHNDISPKNILFDCAKNEAFLIDFGLASRTDEKIKGFRGTPRYAHRWIFGKYPRAEWKSQPAFDNTSLAFSMTILSNKGRALWNSFQPVSAQAKTEFAGWADARSSTASARLKDLNFPEEWLKWCEDGRSISK